MTAESTAPTSAATPSSDDSRAGGAVVVRTPTRRIDVTGADKLAYLDDVTTQAFGDASAGDVLSTLYLDPHGAPLAMFDVAVMADRLALLAPSEDVERTLLDVLAQRTFLLDVTFSPTEDVVTVLRGPAATEVAEAANLLTRPGTVRPAGNEVFVVGRDDGQLDLVGPEAVVDDLTGLLLDAGARQGDADDLEAWRIDAGVPAWGVEVVAPHLPEEVGLLPTHVHLAKGCYPGQEAVARMWMLGRPRRRLATVTAKGGELAPGWQAGTGRRRVTVTSVAPDGGRALAFVPGDTAPGDAFTDDDGNGVEVVALIGTTDRPPGADPTMRRRRDERRP